MGVNLEFNWYIVANDNNILDHDDHLILREREMSIQHTYRFRKADYRVYPMDTPLPLIYNGKCLGMACIEDMNWNNSKTYITVRPILIFNEGDQMAQYYETSFGSYKNQQETINDGGKVDVRSIVNGRERVRL